MPATIWPPSDVASAADNPLELDNPLEALAAFEGRKGGVLWAVSSSDGTKLAEYRFDSPPIFDGMAAAGGRLYLSLKGGKVLCFAGRN